MNARQTSAPHELAALIDRARAFLDRVEAVLPPAPPAIDWQAAVAFRWRKSSGRGWLQPVPRLSQIRLSNLQGVERQRKALEQNTRQFVEGLPANNVLLTGARGTGKSSLIKALLNQYAPRGLRLIEVDKSELVDLGEITDLIERRPERFIIFCDDLSFDEGDASYKALKVALDGSVNAASENSLIYATSNRRHLLPEYMHENLEYKHVGEEIHPGESAEEKISLSERFGIWLSFYPFDQDEYMAIVEHWLAHFGCDAREIEAARGDALTWTIERGSRSGRVAWQFARDRAGRLKKRAPGGATSVRAKSGRK
ncbi:MAG: ATP-binding protein [Burkholderiales bacterium]|nr:ATP-binding protein [Burkholderiales bacterium]